MTGAAVRHQRKTTAKYPVKDMSWQQNLVSRSSFCAISWKTVRVTRIHLLMKTPSHRLTSRNRLPKVLTSLLKAREAPVRPAAGKGERVKQVIITRSSSGRCWQKGPCVGWQRGNTFLRSGDGSGIDTKENYR